MPGSGHKVGWVHVVAEAVSTVLCLSASLNTNPAVDEPHPYARGSSREAVLSGPFQSLSLKPKSQIWPSDSRFYGGKKPAAYPPIIWLVVCLGQFYMIGDIAFDHHADSK